MGRQERAGIPDPSHVYGAGGGGLDDWQHVGQRIQGSKEPRLDQGDLQRERFPAGPRVLTGGATVPT
jgi:hypothetical protein